MFQLLYKAPLSLGPKAFVTKILPQTDRDQRAFLFGLSVANLAFVVPTLLAVVVFSGLRWQPLLGAWLPQILGESDLVFLLGDNRISGVAFGILLGALSALILRRIWIGLIFCSLTLVTGVLAVNVGWGVWMGTMFGFWLHQVIRFQSAPTIRSALRWRLFLVVITILLIFRFSDFLAISIRSLELLDSALENRLFQWVTTGAVTLAIDTVISAFFFHFYFLIVAGSLQQVTNQLGRRR
jgi:hypothetical protein